MTKKNLMPLVVLTVICVAVAALLAGVNALTAPEIAKANLEKVKESLEIVMPEGKFDTPETLTDEAPDTIDSVYKDRNGGGHVVVLVTNKGYTGKNIGITVAIDNEGKIIKTVVTQNEESIVPPELKPMGSYGDHYTGANADEVVDLVTGATVKFTESAIKNALYDAFYYLGYAEDRVLLSAYDLVEGTEELEEVELENTDGAVKRLFVQESSKKTIAYVHTYAQYGGGLETETLIAVDENGTITNIKNLAWTVGHDETNDPPAPTKEMVTDFFNRFIGKNLNDIGSVEVASGATGTSANVIAALTEALTQLADDDGADSYLPRILGICAVCILIAGFTAALIYSRKRRAPYEKQ